MHTVIGAAALLKIQMIYTRDTWICPAIITRGSRAEASGKQRQTGSATDIEHSSIS